jgi:hypothetical protein
MVNVQLRKSIILTLSRWLWGHAIFQNFQWNTVSHKQKVHEWVNQYIYEKKSWCRSHQLIDWHNISAYPSSCSYNWFFFAKSKENTILGSPVEDWW